METLLNELLKLFSYFFSKKEKNSNNNDECFIFIKKVNLFPNRPWDKLRAIGPKYGHFPKPTKSYLIAKEKKLMEAQNKFANSRANIRAEGKRHLMQLNGVQNIGTNM